MIALTSHRIEYLRKWKEAHRERIAERQRAWYAKNKEKCAERMKLKIRNPLDAKRLAVNRENWRARNRIKHRAHSAVWNALRYGKLERPSQCSECLMPCRPQAHHHHGYEKPFQLDVLWICRICHEKIHNGGKLWEQ